MNKVVTKVPKIKTENNEQEIAPHVLNKQIVPLNVDKLDENDEKQFKKMNPITGDMYLYNSSGISMNLKNFYINSSIFLILSGPSLNTYDLSLLSKRGIMTMGVNNSWIVHKPNLWVSVDDPGNFIDIGWKDPSIIKFAPVGHIHKYLVVKEGEKFRRSQFRVGEMPSVFYFRRNQMFRPKSFLHEPTVNWGVGDSDVDEIGCKGGRSVMLAAMKIISYLGFKNVYILGADFKMNNNTQNYAFKQERSEHSVKGNNSTYEKLNKRFLSLLPEFSSIGMKVYNCYKDSGLKAFPYMPYENAVNKASKTCGKIIDSYGWYDRKEKEESKQRVNEDKEADNIKEVKEVKQNIIESE